MQFHKYFEVFLDMWDEYWPLSSTDPS